MHIWSRPIRVTMSHVCDVDDISYTVKTGDSNYQNTKYWIEFANNMSGCKMTLTLDQWIEVEFRRVKNQYLIQYLRSKTYQVVVLHGKTSPCCSQPWNFLGRFGLVLGLKFHVTIVSSRNAGNVMALFLKDISYGSPKFWQLLWSPRIFRSPMISGSTRLQPCRLGLNGTSPRWNIDIKHTSDTMPQQLHGQDMNMAHPYFFYASHQIRPVHALTQRANNYTNSSFRGRRWPKIQLEN